MIELIGTVATIVALVGAWLNNRLLVSCFYCWIFSNLLSAGIHIYLGTWSLAIRDLAFLVMAVAGPYQWKRSKIQPEVKRVVWESGPCPGANDMPPGTLTLVEIKPSTNPPPAMLSFKDIDHDEY